MVGSFGCNAPLCLCLGLAPCHVGFLALTGGKLRLLLLLLPPFLSLAALCLCLGLAPCHVGLLALTGGKLRLLLLLLPPFLSLALLCLCLSLPL